MKMEMAWGRGSAPAYIARWGEPQPSDQTDLKQWLRYIVKVGWRPSCEAGLTWRWAQASQPDMWAQSAPLVSLRASTSFLCLLVSSKTFPSIFAEFRLDLVQFLDSYSFSAYSVFIPKNSKFTKAMEIVMLVRKTLAWWWFWSLLESSESYPSGTFSSELQIEKMICLFRSSRWPLRNGVL
jgi:hypothetical protein